MNDVERYQHELDNLTQRAQKRDAIAKRLQAHDYVQGLLERAVNVGIEAKDLSMIVTSGQNALAQITAEVEKREAKKKSR